MSEIVCKMLGCPYHQQQYGYCLKEIVGIDEMGMCDVWWRHGQQKNPRFDEIQKKEVIVQEVQ